MSEQLQVGDRVAALTAWGFWLEKVVVEEPHMGGNFAVVGLCWLDEPDDDPIRWPLDSTMPLADAPAPPYSHAEYDEMRQAQQRPGSGSGR